MPSSLECCLLEVGNVFLEQSVRFIHNPDIYPWSGYGFWVVQNNLKLIVK
jgi:hypothetical protein